MVKEVENVKDRIRSGIAKFGSHKAICKKPELDELFQNGMRRVFIYGRAFVSVAVGVERNFLFVDPVQIRMEGFLVDIRDFDGSCCSLLPFIAASRFEECRMLD